MQDRLPPLVPPQVCDAGRHAETQKGVDVYKSVGYIYSLRKKKCFLFFVYKRFTKKSFLYINVNNNDSHHRKIRCTFIYCKDENLDHKIGIYCNLIGPLATLHHCAFFVQKGSEIFW